MLYYYLSCKGCVKQTVFSISTSNLQMKGLTGTVGMDAYVTEDRIIWLDCQPLLSSAVAEREMASNHSKYFTSRKNHGFNTF